MPDTVWTVSDVNRHIKVQFEEDPEIQGILVAGEISNFTAHSSGHWYFTLKDTSSRLSCVMFRMYTGRSAFVPKHGDKIIARGSVRVFEPNGQYQLYCTQLFPYGEGELNRKLEALKKKLAEEGLFRDDHKKEIPVYPERIGVICGENTAAYRDVLRTVTRRWPIAEIVPFFSLVQGAGAKENLVHQIREADLAKLDVILIVRGGGSLEDLWPFNEEEVVRAVYEAKTPVISGVGHESDTTLVDYVSDLRASTPTAAAEHATPDIEEVYDIVQDLKSRLCQTMRIISAENNLRIDLLKEKMKRYSAGILHRKETVRSLKSSLIYAAKGIQKTGEKDVRVLCENLMSAGKITSVKTRQKFAETVKLLDAYSPLKILSRGYSVVYNEEQRVVRSVKEVKEKDQWTVRLSDGTVKAEVTEVTENE